MDTFPIHFTTCDVETTDSRGDQTGTLERGADRERAIHHALRGLAPEGLALKRHILDRLLSRTPGWLTAAQVADGGPKRTDASVRCALSALQRIGVTERIRSEDGDLHLTRFRVAPGTEEVVRTFLTYGQEEVQRQVSPVPALPRYLRVLKVLYDRPGRSFTVTDLCDKVRRKDAAVRRSLHDLYEAGFAMRELPDTDLSGRPQFRYRLNPCAATQASALLHGTTELNR